MRALHILLHSRPEVIGKLRTFYHDTYFGVETAHTVCRTHNIVFGNGSTEHTRLSKLLLHALSDIENAALVLIGNILPPNKRIGITPEFRFQGFIDRIHQKHFLSFRLVMHAVLILFRFIGFGQYIIEYGLRIRIGSCQRLTIGCGQVFLRFFLNRFQLFFCETFVAQQHPAELHQRVGSLDIRQLPFIAIEGVFIRIGVRTDAHTVGMHNHRIAVEQCILPRLGHRIHRIENVLTVAMDDFQVLETGKIIGNLTRRGLVLLRNGNGIPVVLPDKNDRQTLQARTIDSLIYKTLGRSRLSMRGDDHPFMPVIHHGTRHTGSMQVMRTCCRGYILDMPLRFGKVVGHVASAASRIRSLRDAVQYQFFGSHSRRKHRQHIPVIREEKIFPLGKHLSHCQLYTVVSGIRRMVRPT